MRAEPMSDAACEAQAGEAMRGVEAAVFDHVEAPRLTTLINSMFN